MRKDLDEETRAWVAVEAVMVGELLDAAPDVELNEAELADVDTSMVDEASVVRILADAQFLIEARWRELLAQARERRERRISSVRQDWPAIPREQLMTRLGELRAAYPSLTLHHRDLGELSDDMLRALIEDIEAVIARGDE